MSQTACGIVLAAGAGRRMGTPKALVGDWLERAVRTLSEGGCDHVLVTLGAARPVVPAPGFAVPTPDWADGLAASVRAGLATAEQFPDAGQAVVLTVDTPDIPPEAVARVLLAARAADSGLARAVYLGRPGHPVALARRHWNEAALSARGDSGLRRYLMSNTTILVECGDLATGEDRDY